MVELKFRVESDRYDEVYLAKIRDAPGGWTVGAYLKDGAIEQVVFDGPAALERAKAYLKAQYGRLIDLR